jgi:hypothetical protein
MAITFTILQANGNAVRSAMAKINFDGETTVPSGAEITLTVAVLNVAGGNVNASAAVTTTAAAITPVDTFARTFAEALLASRTGSLVWLSKNTSDEYILHLKAKKNVAQFVNISAAGYDAAPE